MQQEKRVRLLIPFFVALAASIASDRYVIHKGYPDFPCAGWNVELNSLLGIPVDFEDFDAAKQGVLNRPASAKFCRLAAERARPHISPETERVFMIIGRGPSARGWPLQSHASQTLVEIEGQTPRAEVTLTLDGKPPFRPVVFIGNVAIWFGCFVFLFNGPGWIRRFKSLQRRRMGLCVACGYDLRGSVSGICSECGESQHVQTSTSQNEK